MRPRNARGKRLGVGVLSCLVAGLFGTESLSGQGCSPSRFTSPARWGQGDVYLPPGEWQASLVYRRFTSSNLVQGHDDLSASAPRGLPSTVHSRTLNLSMTYALSQRLALSAGLPYLEGDHTTWYADSVRHTNTARGFGDLQLMASYWLRPVHPMQPGGNLSIGLGVKVPTGSNDVAGRWWNADGSTLAFPVHSSIQLGDGGWGIVAQLVGFQPFGAVNYAYLSASYTAVPRGTTDVVRSPGSTLRWAAPDSWNATVGVARVLWPGQGLGIDLSARFAGTPRRDLIGGRDAGYRLPATTGYLTPSVALTRGAHSVSLAVPVLLYRNFLPSYVDLEAGKLGGGGLADYQLLAGYSVRF